MAALTPVAVFASGNGGNFEAIVEASALAGSAWRVAVLVCDRPGAFVLERARRLGVPAVVAAPRDFASREAYEAFVAERLESYDVRLVCLAGYMRIVGPVLLGRYAGRMVNIHPSLLPSFKGAHGIRDALAYGVKVFGVTVHYVDETLDGGPIIDQEAFHYDGSDLGELEERIHEVEHRLYPSIINRIIPNLR